MTITSQQTPSGTSNNLTGTEKSFRLKFKRATQIDHGTTTTPFEARVFGPDQAGEINGDSAKISVFSASKDENAIDIEDT